VCFNIKFHVSVVILLIRILRKLPIPLPIHQRIHLRRIANLNLRQPPLALGTLVDHARLVLQHTVRFDDLAADGGHDVRGGFDGFDGADGFAGGDFEVEGRELDVDDIAEGFGGVGGDADRACRARELSRTAECIVLYGVHSPVFLSSESSIHSWSSVYLFSHTTSCVNQTDHAIAHPRAYLLRSHQRSSALAPALVGA